MGEPDFDLAVVGGGPAGSYFAYLMAEEGFDVALIDVKKKPFFWEKLCGSVTSRNLLKILEIEEREIILNEFKGFSVRNLDGELLSNVYVDLLVIDRKKAGAEIIELAEDSGVKIYDGKKARDIILDSRGVKGVQVLGKVGEGGKITARLSVDATGVDGILRERLKGKLPESAYEEDDLVLAYMERLKVKENKFKKFQLFITKEEAPGGYLWITPVTEGEIIVGIGASLPLTTISALRGSLNNLKKRHNLEGEILEKGEGLLPVRRPFDSFVFDGFIMIGDAASQGNPFFGGGIEGAIDAARTAKKPIKKALEISESNIVQVEDLWGYNVEFMEKKGVLLGMIDLLRMLAQSLDDKELQIIARNMPKSLQFDLSTLLSIGLKLSGLIFRPRFLWKTVELVKVAQKVRDIYGDYPQEPEKLDKWRNKLEKVFKKFRKTINKM
ncbi:MAG: NAD(P)/FAD-dependent oxidoreductase [Candidatus Njordarchaeia archaeon]